MNAERRTPIFPLRAVLFPDGPLPLRIFEPRYVDMISRCMRENAPFVVTSIIDGSETGPASFETIGTMARIEDFETLPDNLLGILVKGGERVRITRHVRETSGLNMGELEVLAPEPSVAMPESGEDLAILLRELLANLPVNLYTRQPLHFDDATWVGYRLAELLPIGVVQRQYFLEMEDALERLAVLRTLIEALRLSGR